MKLNYLLLAALALPLAAQNASMSSSQAPPHVIVTVEPKKEKKETPRLTAQDVQAFEGKEKVQASNLMPLVDKNAGLQLLILLDDGSGANLATQLNDLREFIQAQPSTTAIGLGYMRNGTVQMASQFTNNHEQLSKSLRIPIGQPGVNGSPYFSVQQAIKGWQPYQGRREILLITDGIDRYGAGTGLNNPYVNDCITQAQKAGIVIYSIYTPGDGHFGRSYWRSSWGQNLLSQLSDETGGESFYMGFGPPVSFKPYLDDLSERLNNQYLLTLDMKPKNKAEMRRLKVHTEVPNAEIAYPDQVWVKAGL